MPSSRVKLQTNLTIDSFEEWAISRMLGHGWKNHDLSKTIVREWLAFKREDLSREYGISREAWENERGGNVRAIGKGRKSRPQGTEG